MTFSSCPSTSRKSESVGLPSDSFVAVNLSALYLREGWHPPRSLAPSGDGNVIKIVMIQRLLLTSDIAQAICVIMGTTMAASIKM